MAEQSPSAAPEEHQEYQLMLELQHGCFTLIKHIEEILESSQYLWDENSGETYGFADEHCVPAEEHGFGDFQWEFDLVLDPFDEDRLPQLSFTRSTADSESDFWREVTLNGLLADDRLRESSITMVSRATNLLFNPNTRQVRIFETDCISHCDSDGVEQPPVMLTFDEIPDDLDNHESMGISPEDAEQEIDELYFYNQLTQSPVILAMACKALATVLERTQPLIAEETNRASSTVDTPNIQLPEADEIELIWEAGEQVIDERIDSVRRYSVSWDDSVEVELFGLLEDATEVEIEYRKSPDRVSGIIIVSVTYNDGNSYRYHLTKERIIDLDATLVPVLRAESDRLFGALVMLGKEAEHNNDSV